jgi:hypothetical protein
MGAGVIAAAAAFAGLSGGVTGFNNIRVIGIIQPDRAARQLVEASAGRGAFDELPARSSVFFWGNDMVWEGPTTFEGYLFAQLMLAHKTGRAYDARVLSPPGPGFVPGSCPRLANPKSQQPTCAPPAAHAAWARVRLRPDGGTVIVAPLANPSTTGFPSSKSQASLIVYRQTDGSRPDPPRLIGRTADQRPWSSDRLRWRRLAGGGTWALYSLHVGRARPIASSLDDDHGFIDFFAMPASPIRAKLMNTRHLLP